MLQLLRPLLPAAKIIFALFLGYFALRLLSYHFALVTFPFPEGLREGAMMTSTDALVRGINPYAMSLQPQLMNQYGIIYPLFVWPWAKFFGTTMLVHRIVTASFILASCVLIYFVLRKLNVPLLLNVWAILMLYSSLIYPATSTPTIDPGATGLFFFLLTIFVPWFYNYSYKSLLISIACGILAFYTKAYFLLGIFIMASFLFIFTSKIKGLFYVLLLLILAGISMVVVNQTLPAYFDNCFFTSINMAHAWSSMQRLHEQVVKYGELHQWTFFLIGAIFLWHGFKTIHNYSWDNIKKNIKIIFWSLRLKGLKEPLFKLDFPLVLYVGTCSSFVLYLSLGRHTGAMLWYFFQLLSPFVLIAAVWLFSRQAFWPILCVPFLIYNLYTMSADQNDKWFNKNMPGWPEVALVISQHQRILNSPLIAPLLIEQHKPIVDDGQAEYFGSGGQRIYWMKSIFKEDGRVMVQLMMYFQNIRAMVEKKAYDLIILQPSLLPLGVADEIQKYYKYEGQLILYAPGDRRPYALTFWKPL